MGKQARLAVIVGVAVVVVVGFVGWRAIGERQLREQGDELAAAAAVAYQGVDLDALEQDYQLSTMGEPPWEDPFPVLDGASLYRASFTPTGLVASYRFDPGLAGPRCLVVEVGSGGVVDTEVQGC